MLARGVTRTFNYLYASIVIGHTEEVYNENLEALLHVIRVVSFKVARKKLIYPSRVYPSLSIPIDLNKLNVGLPVGKYLRLLNLIEEEASKEQLGRQGRLAAHGATVIQGGMTSSECIHDFYQEGMLGDLR